MQTQSVTIPLFQFLMACRVRILEFFYVFFNLAVQRPPFCGGRRPSEGRQEKKRGLRLLKLVNLVGWGGGGGGGQWPPHSARWPLKPFRIRVL